MGILGNSQNLLKNFNIGGASAFSSRISPWVLTVFTSYAVSDLATLQIRSQVLPKKAPPTRPAQKRLGQSTPRGEYDIIAQRNIFNEDGKVAPPLGATGEEQGPMNEQAVKSNLPLTLLGTIVHFNPNRSIATIQVNNKNETLSYIVDEEVAGMARITEVGRKRVTFVNLKSRRLEYIDIPEEAAFGFDLQAGAKTKPSGAITQTGRFQYNVPKTEFKRLTDNLSTYLQQARMEPRLGPTGAVEGFCFVSIQGGSPYESFGFQQGDCILSVNGEPIDSPQKAMEAYNRFKGDGGVRLGVERDGRVNEHNYTVQ